MHSIGHFLQVLASQEVMEIDLKVTATTDGEDSGVHWPKRPLGNKNQREQVLTMVARDYYIGSTVSLKSCSITTLTTSERVVVVGGEEREVGQGAAV